MRVNDFDTPKPREIGGLLYDESTIENIKVRANQIQDENESPNLNTISIFKKCEIDLFENNIEIKPNKSRVTKVHFAL